MKKSTLFNASDSGVKTKESAKSAKELPKNPRKETIDNIMAFAHAYSVRKSRNMDYIDVVLN